MVAIIKTITDLERIGDEVEKVRHIAGAARDDGEARRTTTARSGTSAGIVTEMVHDALHSFARLDADEAFEVARRDRKVDEEYESIQRQNITFMMEDPRSIRRALDDHVGRCARSSASVITPRISASTWSTWCTARTSATSRSTTRNARSATSRAARTRGLMPGAAPGNHGLAACACAAALAFAFYAQYGMGLVPTPPSASSSAWRSRRSAPLSWWQPSSRVQAAAALLRARSSGSWARDDRDRGRQHVWIQMQAEGADCPPQWRGLAFMLDLFPLTEVILKVFMRRAASAQRVDWSFLGLSDAGLGAKSVAVPLTASSDSGSTSKNPPEDFAESGAAAAMSSGPRSIRRPWWIVRLSRPNSTTPAPSAPEKRLSGWFRRRSKARVAGPTTSATSQRATSAELSFPRAVVWQ